jgi:NitT/TauT family transport system substrate-binding protein
MKLGRITTAIALISALALGSGARAQTLEKISIVTFGPPSYGAFLPPVIKHLKLDEKHGLDITFHERTPDAYSVQFNSGEFQVGASASLLTIGLAANRGVKVTYLFNLYDYWTYIVTSRADVKTLKDLEGKDLAAAKGTTNYVLFDWFARRLGVDLTKVSVVNTATPGLLGYAMADRAAAVNLWDPAYTQLVQRNPKIRTLDLQIRQNWEKFTGTRHIPYLGVAAHTDWVAKNEHLVPKLYDAYKDAIDWTLKNPDAAAKLILPKASPDDQRAVTDLIKENDKLGMGIAWAHDVRKELESVYKAGHEMGFLPAIPGPETIYAGPKK